MSLLEANVLFALGSLMTDEERAAGKKLPVMRQARMVVKVLPKATRVAEFIAMWTVVKYRDGATTAEQLAEFWGQPERTAYKRLEEFREVWGPAGLSTPDALADSLIASYRARQEKLTAASVTGLLTAEVPVDLTAVEPAISP